MTFRGSVLVIGGAGYVGSHCCKALAKAGFQPVVFDNLSTGHADFVHWGPIIEGDIRDKAALLDVLDAHRPVAVMHFAALALVGESMTDPARYYDVNVCGTLRLLEAMTTTEVSRLVFSSTCAVYGEPETVPIGEATEKQPVNPYGMSKLVCERMMDDFDRAHGVRSIRLRYFNAAGADGDGEIGEWHENETHLVPLVIEAALGRREAVGIFGTDYATPDGTAVRDYVHVEDLARAHVAALERLLAGGDTDAINLGTGQGTSVSEVVAAVERVSNRRVPRHDRPRRPGDPPTLVANPSRARAVLGWKAEKGLDDIVSDAFRWHASRNVG